MTTEIGHASFLRRIAINVGAGFVPGLNAVIMGAAIAAGKLGWEMVGIRDGFDGLLHPEQLSRRRTGNSKPSTDRESGSCWLQVFSVNPPASIHSMCAK